MPQDNPTHRWLRSALSVLRLVAAWPLEKHPRTDRGNQPDRECKTSRFGNQPAADSGILYKLESLGSNAGGLFGRMLLLSARPLTEAERNRAASQRINVLEGAELAGLRGYVRRWMGD